MKVFIVTTSILLTLASVACILKIADTTHHATVYAANSTNLGPEQTVRVIPLNQTCTTKDATSKTMMSYTLTRAFRISTIADMRTYVYLMMDLENPEIGINDFVIFEAKADNKYLSRRLRMVRPHTIRAPYDISEQYPGTLPSNALVYAAFPVRPDEQTFNLLFCSFDTPTHIDLDFSRAQTQKGNYSVTQGALFK